MTVKQKVQKEPKKINGVSKTQMTYHSNTPVSLKARVLVYCEAV